MNCKFVVIVVFAIHVLHEEGKLILFVLNF